MSSHLLDIVFVAVLRTRSALSLVFGHKVRFIGELIRSVIKIFWAELKLAVGLESQSGFNLGILRLIGVCIELLHLIFIECLYKG